MKNIIVGTAGHIDHGKTALVRALTGIDTDRLEEEKRRGISIDLGFAHLEINGCTFGFVDVPGHERFVRNMLAGIGGIDLVLLVISAEEAIKPQTREHFDICRLLGIPRGIVVLTKTDLVAPDWLDMVRLEAEDFVRGSFLEGAPIIPVSARTGDGLNLLRQALPDVAEAVPGRDLEGFPRLPVDRCFSMKGFGTVVTGTLLAGSIRPEQELELYPVGLRIRIRNIQVHGKSVQAASAGQRTAVNIAGVEVGDVARGMVLAPRGILRATSTLDCELHLLPSAKPLKHRAPVHFHSGTAEMEAEVRLLKPEQQIEPGHSGLARLHLKQPALLLPGDRFIIRMFSPVVTIGGGTVVESQPAGRMRRTAVAGRTAQLAQADLTSRLQMLLSEHPEGVALSELVARTGQPESQLKSALPANTLMGSQGSDPLVIASASLHTVADRIKSSLREFHKANPLVPGMNKAEAPVPPAVLELVLAANPDLIAEGDTLRLKTHSLQLKQEEDAALATIENLFRDAGLTVPATAEVLQKSGLELARARALLQILLKRGTLVRVSTELIFHTSAMQKVRGLLATKKGTRFGVSEFKEWTGVSRKYAIPLLEHLDRERITRRDGDQRLVL